MADIELKYVKARRRQGSPPGKNQKALLGSLFNELRRKKPLDL